MANPPTTPRITTTLPIITNILLTLGVQIYREALLFTLPCVKMLNEESP
jgi:hypothetical protein